MLAIIMNASEELIYDSMTQSENKLYENWHFVFG